MITNRRLMLVATALVIGVGSIAAAQAAEPSEASLIGQVKISKTDAEKIALRQVKSGIVKSAELEQEHGALVWSFDIAKPKTANISEVLVNAKTGAIVHVGVETPSAQAKEEAADKAEQSAKPATH